MSNKTIVQVVNELGSLVEPKRDLLKAGNKKLAKIVGCFSMTPIASCYDCSTCAKSCYGVQAMKQYKNSRVAWHRNHELSKQTDLFIATMNNEIRYKGWKIVRLHSNGGDFYNQTYTNAWRKIMKANPQTIFYTYTKNPCKYVMSLNELPNVNVIYSFIETPIGRLRNYGTETYCNLVSELFDVHICSLDESKGEKCMQDCTHCLTSNSCLIVEHGSGKYKDTYETDVDEDGKTIIDKLMELKGV